MHKLLDPVKQRMGKLLGPSEIAEIVITLYEDEQINYQIMGRTGALAPEKAYRLLAIVANEVARDMPQPSQVQPQETPTA